MSDAAKTPASPSDILGALLKAGAPSYTAAVVLASQSAVETAGWHAMYNWNLGNITAYGGQSYVIQPNNVLHFRDYSDLQAGADDFYAFLVKRGLIGFAANADIQGYVNQLANTCYVGCIGQTDANGITTDQTTYDNYLAGMSSWYHKLNGVQPTYAIDWKIPVAIAVLAGGIAYALHHDVLRLHWPRF